MKRTKRITKRARKAILKATKQVTILEEKKPSKTKKIFLLSEYLKKKALKKAEKLVHRDEKRQAKAEHKHDHKHDHDHDHDHEHEDK